MDVKDLHRERSSASGTPDTGDNDGSSEPGHLSRVVDQSVQEPLSLGRRRAGGVAQHAVVRDSRHATVTKVGEELAHRSSVSELCSIEVDEVGCDVKHQRCFRPSRVCITTMQNGHHDINGVPLRSKLVGRGTKSIVVPPMPAENDQSIETIGGRAGEFDEDADEGLGPDRQGAGEVLVLPGCAERQYGCDERRFVDGRGEGSSPGLGDDGVGADRKVRTVLLGRPEGNDEEARRIYQVGGGLRCQ